VSTRYILSPPFLLDSFGPLTNMTRAWVALNHLRRLELTVAGGLLLLLALDQALPPPIPPEALGLVIAARDGTPLRTYPSLDRCWIPCDHVPIRSWPLFKARDVMRSVVESFRGEQKQ
jgi:hypothetical protein